MRACSAIKYLAWPVYFGLAAIALLVAAPKAFADGQTHVVQSGENLYRLSLRYGVTVGDLMRANGLSNPDYLSIGQQLVIPAQPGSVQSQQGGGTFYPQTLDPQPAAVPTPDPAPEAQAASEPAAGLERYHQVGFGDTLWGIANTYGVSVRDIQRANGLSNANYIEAGQILVIPAPGSLPVAPARNAPAPQPAPADPPVQTADFAPWFTADFSRAPAFKLTHYCLYGPMASTRYVYSGAVAADASIFPIGTRLLIEGLAGIFTVEDRFGWDANQFRLDVWVPTCDEAVQRGVQYRRVLRVVP